MNPVDPFGYWPTHRSRITGLGGDQDPSEPSYIFHTPYSVVAPGPSIATVAFEGLAATAGLIEVSVFQRHAEHMPPVTEQGKASALLTTVARTNRPISVTFDAIPGAQYAVIGLAYGDLRARARGLAVAIGARSADDDLTRQRSLFGRMKARRVTGLAATGRPSLRAPVSQGYSHAQTEEPEFDRWATSLPAGDPLPARWEAAYILSVLDVYGRLAPGARGLAIARGPDPVATIAADLGCAMTTAALHAGEEIDAGLARILTDSRDGLGFDFLWSRTGIFDGLNAVRAQAQIEDLLQRLRPGGLAIHILAAGKDARDDVLDSNALNRIALGLVATGHIVGELRHDHQAGDAATRREPNVPFGIIVRRATDPMV